MCALFCGALPLHPTRGFIKYLPFGKIANAAALFLAVHISPASNMQKRMLLQVGVEGNHSPHRVWDSVPRKRRKYGTIKTIGTGGRHGHS